MRSTEPKWLSSARRLAGPDAAQVVEQGVARLGSSLLPVIADREAVSLVADALQQLETRRGAVEHDRAAAGRERRRAPPAWRARRRRPAAARTRASPRAPRTAAPSRRPRPRDWESRRRTRPSRERWTALRRARSGGTAPPRAPRSRPVALTDAGPRTSDTAPCAAVHRWKTDHRADCLAALGGRDVEALDAHGQALEVERLAQLLERRHATQLLPLGRRRRRHERELRVLRRELRKPALVAPESGAHDDPRAAPLREQLLQSREVSRPHAAARPLAGCSARTL